jgi:hypothetical protein
MDKTASGSTFMPPEAAQSGSQETLTRLMDWFLEGQDEVSLARYYKADLAALCTARGLDASGTKAEMISALVHWVNGYSCPRRC